jgi:hypothetical protein
METERERETEEEKVPRESRTLLRNLCFFSLYGYGLLVSKISELTFESIHVLGNW